MLNIIYLYLQYFLSTRSITHIQQMQLNDFEFSLFLLIYQMWQHEHVLLGST